MQEETISIQIPEGAEAGDELSFFVGGQELSIPVPAHSQPGDVLQIKLGASKKVTDGDVAMEGEEANETIISMMTGHQLCLAGNESSKSKQQPLTGTADGTFRCLWPASKFVINYMNTSSEFHRMIQDGAPIRSVLELGAGAGMFGMAFADIVSYLSSNNTSMQVALTDMEEAIDPLRQNVVANCSIFHGRVQFSTIPLTWHSVPMSATSCSIDYILGSDLLYNCKSISDLAATIRRLLSKTSKVLFSVRWRKPIEERAFFVALSDILEWSVVHGTCPLDYRNYGNPACDESNKYFQQTMVCCNGKAVPLSMIDEAATNQMTEVEFVEYEALQTQVYFGQVIDGFKARNKTREPKRLKTG